MHKVDMDTIGEYERQAVERGDKQDIGSHQVAVYVMCGGGILGRSAAEQPAGFYIDSRCGRLPYNRKEIEQAVAVLAIIAEVQGLDAHSLPKMPDFHACGIF